MTETVLGNYRLLETLGEGGMGTVYLAEHRRIPRRVAIKVLRPELSHNPAILDRFFKEARAAATIQHSSIVEIFDCDIHDGRAYIVMTLLQGESLGARLKRAAADKAELPLPEIVETVTDIARGMEAAHAHGIIHRDLKPDNIFLHAGPSGRQVKILDFGIAKLANDGGANTAMGAMLGTPPYMSPEQCRGAGQVDARSDIYSLGCMFFEMLCGRPPFVREGAGDLIVAHLFEPVPSAGALRPGVPAALDAILERLMAKEPAARFQTMGDVVRAFATFRAPAPDAGAPATATGKRRRRTGPVLGITALVVAVVATAAFATRRQAKPEPRPVRPPSAEIQRPPPATALAATQPAAAPVPVPASPAPVPPVPRAPAGHGRTRPAPHGTRVPPPAFPVITNLSDP